MHALQQFADKQVASGKWPSPMVGHYLSNTEAATSAACLKDDAAGFLYSACVSICDAVRGIQGQLHSWATTKLYYSVFYGVRALMAARGRGVFYERKKPRRLHAVPGAEVTQPKGATSHATVLGMFSQEMPGHALLDQPIELLLPPLWLMQKREEANYRQCRFGDPVAPAHFRGVSRMGLRRALEAYVSDDSTLYAFVPDHAMLAYPILVLQQCSEVAKREQWFRLQPEDLAFLEQTSRDAAGPLPSLIRLFGTLATDRA